LIDVLEHLFSFSGPVINYGTFELLTQIVQLKERGLQLIAGLLTSAALEVSGGV
jgi:hypothetical protein